MDEETAILIVSLLVLATCGFIGGGIVAWLIFEDKNDKY